jgi:hypothetical protein
VTDVAWLQVVSVRNVAGIAKTKGADRSIGRCCCDGARARLFSLTLPARLLQLFVESEGHIREFRATA